MSCRGRDPGRVAAQGRPCRRPNGLIVAVCRAPLLTVPRPPTPLAPRPCAPCPAHRSAQTTVSWPSAARVSGRVAGLPHDTALPQALTWSQYTRVYCDTMPSLSSSISHNTISVLRYNSALKPHSLQYKLKLPYNFFFFCNTLHIAIQTTPQTVPLSQYTFLSHNTIWAIAHPNFCCIFFFVFHYIYIYIYIFQFFPTTGKHQNIYIPIFFLIFQNTQINL